MAIYPYGIHDYISPELPTEEILLKLKNQIQQIGEKHHQALSKFNTKRRSLTTLLEEINMSGDVFER